MSLLRTKESGRVTESTETMCDPPLLSPHTRSPFPHTSYKSINGWLIQLQWRVTLSELPSDRGLSRVFVQLHLIPRWLWRFCLFSRFNFEMERGRLLESISPCNWAHSAVITFLNEVRFITWGQNWRSLKVKTLCSLYIITPSYVCVYVCTVWDSAVMSVDPTLSLCRLCCLTIDHPGTFLPLSPGCQCLVPDVLDIDLHPRVASASSLSLPLPLPLSLRVCLFPFSYHCERCACARVIV